MAQKRGRAASYVSMNDPEDCCENPSQSIPGLGQITKNFSESLDKFRLPTLATAGHSMHAHLLAKRQVRLLQGHIQALAPFLGAPFG